MLYLSESIYVYNPSILLLTTIIGKKEINNKYFIIQGSDKSLLIIYNNFKLFYDFKKKNWIYNAFNLDKNPIKGQKLLYVAKMIYQYSKLIMIIFLKIRNQEWKIIMF